MTPSIPDKMQAVQIDAPQGKLNTREVPVPRPAAGQVLIRIAAAPLNPSDLGTLAGYTYGGERTYPFTPGLEGSGTVIAAGEGWMPRLLLGRRVACSALSNGDGTWAEYMVTSAALCIPLAGNISLEQGAMLIVNPLTALAIFEIAGQGGHRAIVSTAAASALGWMILRLGQRHNLPIIHVVRRPEQLGLVRSRGGESILNSSDPAFEKQLQALAVQLRATLLLDAIAGDMTQQLMDAAPRHSTILLYSQLSTQNSTINPRTALTKDLRLQGFFLGNWMARKSVLQTLLLSRQAQALLASDLSSPVQKRLPLSAAQEGLDLYLRNMTAGKVLLVADPRAMEDQ